MERISLEGKDNFFEKRVSTYAKAGVGKDKEQDKVDEQKQEDIKNNEKEPELEQGQQRRFLPDGREDLSGGPDAV